MAVPDIDKGCRGTTIDGYPCSRNKERCTSKYTQVAALMQRQRSSSLTLSMAMPSARVVGLEFCFQHKRQAELLHALIKQQQKTGPVKDGHRLTPETGLNVLDIQDPDIRATFFDIPAKTVFLQQDIDHTVARIPTYAATQRNFFSKNKPAVVKFETDNSSTEDDLEESMNATTILSPDEDKIAAAHLSAATTDLAIARRQNDRLSRSLSPGRKYKVASAKLPKVSSPKNVKTSSNKSRDGDRATTTALPFVEGTTALLSPGAIQNMVDDIVRRTLQQTAAMQKAQQEYKMCARVYRQDLDRFQQLLKEQRQAMRKESETDSEHED